MRNRRGFIRDASKLAAALGIPRVLSGLTMTNADSVKGTAFYVDTEGNNESSGLSATDPWKDFSHINQMTFGAGDSIFLRRGCTWHEELTLHGAGTPEHFLVVSAYGSGSRPKIQRNGWPEERCVHLQNARYLKLSSLEVCDAGAGIVLFYNHSYNNRSVYLDDILAHDFRKVPSFREGTTHGPAPTARHDRVTWAYGIGVTGVEDTANDQTRVLTDFRVTNTEVYNTGAGIALDWANHSCVDGKLVLENKFGDVFMDGLHLHDNTVEGDSFASLYLTSVSGCTIQNSVIARGARYAATGTAAIQVNYARNVTLRNVSVSDTPFNACPDNAGLDFECNNENMLVEGCTFTNNAGPAIEILATPGNEDPYTRNLTIRNCSFEGNNWARKLGHSQINVPNWDHGNRPSGLIEHNRYKNAPNTVFFGGDGNTTQVELKSNVNIGFPIKEPVLLKSWKFETESDCMSWCDSARHDISEIAIQRGAMRGVVTGVDPNFLSPPALGLPINSGTLFRILLKNGTAGAYGQLYFLTEEDTHWDECKHRDFWLYPEAAGFRTYDIEMSDQPQWKGVLRQFRFDPEQGVSGGTFEVKVIQVLQRSDIGDV